MDLVPPSVGSIVQDLVHPYQLVRNIWGLWGKHCAKTVLRNPQESSGILMRFREACSVFGAE